MPETKKAAGLTAAKEKRLQLKAYQMSALVSIAKLKIRIGELLLRLQLPMGQQQKQCAWDDFERLLAERWAERC